MTENEKFVPASDCNVMETYDNAPDGGIIDALKGLLSFFTILPINIGFKEMKAMDKKFYLIPLIGLLFGVIAVAIFHGTYYLTANLLISAATTVLVLHLFNRMLHLDGLIDVGDGYTASGSREIHLRALKDTTIGAGGMALGMLVTILLIAEYNMYYDLFPFIIIPCEIVARNSQIAVSAFGIAGNGMAGNSVRFTDKSSLIKSTIISLILIIVIIFSMNHFLPIPGPYFIYAGGITVVGISILWGLFMAKKANKTFGMVNGDVIGATNETTRVIAIFVMYVIWRLYLL